MNFIKNQIIKMRISARNLFVFLKFILGKDYNCLKNSNKKIILFDTPDHGNLGDHAIAIAEQKFLRDNFDCVISEFTHNEYCLFKRYIVNKIQKEDTIIITGGGFIGTLWKEEQDIIMDILNQFKYNHIVIMPQTAFFSSDEIGINEENKFKVALNNCTDITVMLRDKCSFKKIKELDTSAKLLLVPDIVTYLRHSTNARRENKVLLCLRTDMEKVINTSALEPVLSYLNSKDLILANTDTVVPRLVSKAKRKYELNKKLVEFSSAKLVITDRLHGMLLATITSTPCLAFDNISGKVFGTYEFIKYLDYIKFAETNTDIFKKLTDLIETNKYSAYNNTALEKYYSAMAAAIKGEKK